MARDSFIFYRSFYEAILELPKDNRLEIMTAICKYSLDFKAPKFTGISKVVWTLIKPQIDANIRRYKNGTKGAEHGKKGGRPTTNKTPKEPLKNPKLTPNKNVNVNVNVNENIKYRVYLDLINQITGKKLKAITDKTKGQINARLKDGYTIEDFTKAVNNCRSNEFHIENPHHLTLEFITRPDMFEKWLNAEVKTVGQVTKHLYS